MRHRLRQRPGRLIRDQVNGRRVDAFVAHVTRERCRPLLGADGEVIATVRGEEPLSPEDESAMRELVAAVQRIEWSPEQTARYEAARVRDRERLARVRGEVGG